MTPRYLRFAQALALCSGLATLPACPSSSELRTDGGTPGTDAPRTDLDAPATGTDAPVAATDAPSTGTDAPSTGSDAPFTFPDAPFELPDAPFELADAPFVEPDCAACRCDILTPVDAGPDPRPDCWSVPGSEICCAVIGPLSPPDLPA